MTLNREWQKEWDDIEIPHEKINQIINRSVQEAPNQQRKIGINFKSPVMTFVYGALVASVIVFAASSIINNQADNYYMTSENSGAVAKSEVSEEGAEEAKISFSEDEMTEVTNQNGKIITEYQISKQSNHLKEDYGKVKQLVTDYKGMITSSEVDLTGLDYNNPSAYLTLNVPSDKVDHFLEELEKIGKTTNSSTSQFDVSTEYFDNESRIKSLETEEKALLNLLEKSDKVEDMITIQGRLSTIRSEREDLVRGNKSLDKQIDYTTINLYLDEVITAKPQKNDNFWERVKLNWHNQQVNLKQFGENLLVFLLSYGIYILIGVIFIGVIIWKISK